MNRIEKLDIDKIRTSNLTDYTDVDLFIINDILNKIDSRRNTFNINFIAIIICYSGTLSGELNTKKFSISTQKVLVCKPNSIISIKEKSDDLKVGLIGLTLPALDISLFTNKLIWQIEFYIAKNPILHIQNEEDLQLINLYHDIVAIKNKYKSSAFHKEIIRGLLYCVIYELAAFVCKQSESENVGKEELRQGDILFRNFIKILSEADGKVHSVQEVADKLNVSAKYLSTTVKKVSKRTAMYWIHDYMSKAIEKNLKYSSLSIKEIATKLNFENISFFGKFTKQHLGCSPKEYRKKMTD